MNLQPLLPLSDTTWTRRRDGDPTVRALYERHYSCHHYRDGRRPAKTVGPGEYIVLMTDEADALFVWRKFIDASGQTGINCAVFRNETGGRLLSSELILDAERYARDKWPGERFYTYVDARKILSPNPGYCFIMAGWKRVGKTKGGLDILAKEPSDDHA